MNVSEQYAKSDNLKSRISIYGYAIDPERFYSKVSRIIAPATGSRIVELGCGTGELWKALYPMCSDCDILISDGSQGMVETSKANLQGYDIEIRQIDYHDIPLDDNSADIVISNHNLYHANDLDAVLRNVARILRPGGVFYTSTNAPEHMMDLKNLLGLTHQEWPHDGLVSQFGSQNGREILSGYFDDISCTEFPGELHITDFEPIIAYGESLSSEVIVAHVKEHIQDIRKRFDGEVSKQGYCLVHTMGVLFAARKPKK